MAPLTPILTPLNWSMQDKRVGQDIDDIGRGGLSPDPDRQALVGEPIHDIDRAEGPALMGPAMREVGGPDMVGPLGA